MKQIYQIIILISTLGFSTIKGVFVVEVNVTTKVKVNTTDLRNSSSESLNLFRDDLLNQDIAEVEEELGGINFTLFFRQVDQKKVQYFFENEKRNTEFNYLITYNNYKLLCLGDKSLPTKIQSKLKCRYINRGIPFLKIAPFKEEEAYLEPRIVIFHDVLYQEEIETMKRLALPKMERAAFFNPTTGESEFDDGRVTDTAWLGRVDHKHLDNVYLRVQLMTGLSVESAEDFQVANYPLYGKYEPHFDFRSINPQKTYDSPPYYYERIATVLFYMNNVEDGGNTVFTKLDVSLTPKTGSAAFWYNLKPNGLRDYLTMHAACPVVSGSKWAANLWIREAWQEFHRPCTLDNQPRDEEWEYMLANKEEFLAPNVTSHLSDMYDFNIMDN